jgi:hypothetical protein
MSVKVSFHAVYTSQYLTHIQWFYVIYVNKCFFHDVTMVT